MQTLAIPDAFVINDERSITTKAMTGIKLVLPFTAPFRLEIQELEAVDVE